MSTRGFIGVVIDGVEKITFNHFDSYPSGLGEIVLNQLLNGEITRSLAKSLTTVTDSSYTADSLRKLVSTTVGLTPWLQAGRMIDFHEFPLDSLFAEWGYIVDFDDDIFEMYRGFQIHPHTEGRFAGRGDPKPRGISGNTYYPVKLTGSWPLDKLPSIEDFKDFVSLLYDSADE